jgi:hypothetical protein
MTELMDAQDTANLAGESRNPRKFERIPERQATCMQLPQLYERTRKTAAELARHPRV